MADEGTDGAANGSDGAEDDDPFDRLGDAGDREGDPFDDLGYPAEDSDDPDRLPEEGVDTDAGDPSDPESWQPPTSGPAEDTASDAGPDDAAAGGEAGPGVPGPQDEGATADATPDAGVDVDDIVSDVPPEERQGDPFGASEGVFEQVDVGEVDPDAVFDQLASAESRGSVSDQQERDTAEVNKHSYCEQCQWFSPPPDAHCTHAGTEILAYIDMETVRVVDCPVVAERRSLGQQE